MTSCLFYQKSVAKLPSLSEMSGATSVSVPNLWWRQCLDAQGLAAACSRTYFPLCLLIAWFQAWVTCLQHTVTYLAEEGLYEGTALTYRVCLCCQHHSTCFCRAYC